MAESVRRSKKARSSKLKNTGERLIPEDYKGSITYGEHIARYRSVSESIASKMVLDIACGTGYGSLLMSKTAKKVIGVDISEEAVEYAKANFSGQKVSYLVGSATNIPVKDGSVDVVVSLETIEHVDDQETFLKEVKRVLKPEGNLFISTPNDKEYPKGNEFHVREHDRRSFQKLLSQYFNNQVFYYQTDEVASSILAEERLNSSFEAAKWDLVKDQPLTAEKSIYYFVSCSDGKPLPIKENTVLSEFFSHHEASSRWLREKWLNDHAKMLEEQIARLELNLIKANQEITDIRNSRLFRVGNQYWTARRRLSGARKPRHKRQ